MASKSATLLVDDQDKDVKYLCPVQSQTVLGSYYNNTWTTPTGADCVNGWFEYSFFGTGVQIGAGFSRTDQSIVVKIDDGPPTTLTTQNRYESPILADGPHRITYSYGPAAGSFASIDYLTVTAGSSTPLMDRTIIVDDSHHSLSFDGKWSKEAPRPLRFDSSNWLYRNTTRWTHTTGDSMVFTFVGTSVSVMGILSNIDAGRNISVTYTVDDVPFITPLPTGALNSVPMTQLFRSPTLSPGRHRLLMDVTEISPSQALGVDFIAYNASFATLESMPTIEPTGATSSAGTNDRQKLVGTVVGGVVVGIVLLAVAVVAYIQWRKRQAWSRRKFVQVKA